MKSYALAHRAIAGLCRQLSNLYLNSSNGNVIHKNTEASRPSPNSNRPCTYYREDWNLTRVPRPREISSRDLKIVSWDFFTCREDQNNAWWARKLLIERFKPTFLNFNFTFPDSTFHDFLLAPHHNIYISAKKNGEKKHIDWEAFNAVYLLTGT